MNIIICIIYFLVGIYLIFNLRKKNKKNNFVGCYAGITFGILLYYCIIPIIVILNTEQIINQFPQEEKFITGRTNWELIFPAILVLVGFFIFNCAYNQSNKKNTKDIIEFNDQRFIFILKLVGFFTLIIGGISLIIYFGAFGGIKNAFSYAEIFRSFSTDKTNYISGTYVILIVPARLVTVAPFAFYLLLKEKQVKNKFIFKICFVISTILAIMYYIFNAGRAPLICFILSFALVYVYKFIKKPWKLIIVIAIFSLPLLDILDSFSLYLQLGNWRKINIGYMNYIYQFMYPFENIINMENITDIFGFRYGQDFITSIIAMIPGINFSASYENTSLFFGGINWKITGGTPNDLLTFSYIEFGIIGIPLIFGILGYMLGKVDNVLKIIPEKTTKILLASAMAIHLFTFVPSADFISFIRGGFIIIFLGIIILYSYRRKERE